MVCFSCFALGFHIVYDCVLPLASCLLKCFAVCCVGWLYGYFVGSDEICVLVSLLGACIVYVCWFTCCFIVVITLLVVV